MEACIGSGPPGLQPRTQDKAWFQPYQPCGGQRGSNWHRREHLCLRLSRMLDLVLLTFILIVPPPC
jgi:hypothetical protein